MGDNRETVAQAVYGKSEDDLEREEQRELKSIMRGEPATESDAARDHEEAVRRDDDVATVDAASHKQSNHSTMHEAPLKQQLSTEGGGQESAEQTRQEYPTESDQKVTTAVESDKKV